jgi:large subunit ribosomal protein L3
MIGYAQKIGMTRLFVDGRATPVTALHMPKNYVLQTKTSDKDGYRAVQVGAFNKKSQAKPLVGHVKKHASEERCFQCLGEFKIELPEDKKFIELTDFAQDDLLSVSAKSVGKGFTGVVKRYGFRGQPKSHGHDHVRAPGSIGCRTEPGKVHKGQKMAGHQGAKQVTISGLKIVAIDPEKELLFVGGSVPGANKSFLKIRKQKS